MTPNNIFLKELWQKLYKVAGEVYFDSKVDNTGGATNLYANTVSGYKKAGGISGNISSVKGGNIGIEDNPLGLGFEGDTEENIGSDPEDQVSGSEADTGKYYPYPIWGIWKGEKRTYVVNIGKVL